MLLPAWLLLVMGSTLLMTTTEPKQFLTGLVMATAGVAGLTWYYRGDNGSR